MSSLKIGGFEMKVEQYKHANQYHIYNHTPPIKVDCLQSYNSLVVKVITYTEHELEIILGRDWDYSTTTSKHVYEFLEEYGISFDGVTNKRKYVNNLIAEGVIKYDPEMI